MNGFDDNSLHPIQMQILHRLLFAKELRFADLRVTDLTTDHLTYHINKLLEIGLLEKPDTGRYRLSDAGKVFANRMNEHTLRTEKQGKTVVLVRVVRPNDKGELEYLVCKRLKQPFYGFVGFHTGKAREGELYKDTALRELKEETGLSAELVYIGWFHYIDFKQDGTFLRDITFHTFNAYNPSGELVKINEKEGVENFWSTKDELKKEKTFPGFWDKERGLTWLEIPALKEENKDIYFIEKIRTIDEF